MSLSKTAIPVQFSGLSNKSPDKLAVAGELLTLDNCIRRKGSPARGGSTAAVQKRNGFDAMPRTVLGGGTIAASTLIDVYDDELIQLADDKLYSYSQANESWVSKGNTTSVQVDVQPLVRNQSVQSQPDVAYGNGLMCVVYEDTRGGIRYSIFDDASGAALVYDTVIDATATTIRPKVVATSAGFIIGYLALGGANYKLFTQAIGYNTPTMLDASLKKTVVNGTAFNTPWDMDLYSQSAICFAYNNNGSTVTYGFMDANGVVGAPGTNGLPAPVATIGTGTAAQCLSVVADAANNRMWVIYNGSASVDRVLAVDSTLSTAVSFNMEAGTTSYGCAGVVKASGGHIVAFFEHQGTTSAPRDNLVRYREFSWNGSGAISAVTSIGTFMRSVGIWSRAFEVDGRQYITLAHQNALQPTYFVVRDDGYVVSKALADRGGGLTAASGSGANVGRVVLDSQNRYALIVQNRIQLQILDDGTTLSANIGLSKAALSFDGRIYGTTLGRNYTICGGVPLAYDGVAVAELGFFIYPEGTSTDGTLDTAVSAAATSLVGTDVFYFQALYEWTDGKGQIHRSAPSILTSKAPGVNGNKITVKVPLLRVTAKPGTAVNIVLYVSLANTPAVLYRYTSVANSGSDFVSIDFTALPSAVAEILYTTGGVLDNIAPPPSTCIIAHKSRLFLGGTDDKTVWFSKYAQPDEGIGFQDVVPINIESAGGPVTAFASMDEKLVIFKGSRIYYLSGEGPTDTGQQSDYFVPIKIAHDVGTVLPLSIVSTPTGVMFKSEKGIYLLDRSFRIEYIGAAVENYNAEAVTSAVLLPNEDEVRFTTAAGPALVYNYYFSQWSTFLNHESVSAVNALGTYIHLAADGTAYRENLTSWEDAGKRIGMTIETGWFATAGIQGFQRIYKALLLGDFLNHCFCRVSIAYDYEDAYTDTIYFDTRIGLDSTSTYGEGATYGDATPYGGDGSSVFQLRLQPIRQKCESFKIKIEDIDTVDANGGGCFTLLAITLEVGRKYGAYKLAARKSIG